MSRSQMDISELDSSYDADLDQTRSSIDDDDDDDMEFVPSEPTCSRLPTPSADRLCLTAPMKPIPMSSEPSTSTSGLPAHLQVNLTTVTVRPKMSFLEKAKRKLLRGNSKKKERSDALPATIPGSLPSTSQLDWKSRIKYGPSESEHQTTRSVQQLLSLRCRSPANSPQSPNQVAQKMWYLCHMLRGNVPGIYSTITRLQSYVLLHVLQATSFSEYLPLSLEPPSAFVKLVLAVLDLSSHEGEDLHELHKDYSSLGELISDIKPERVFSHGCHYAQFLVEVCEYFEAPRHYSRHFNDLQKLYSELRSNWSFSNDIRATEMESDSFCDVVQPVALTEDFINCLGFPENLLQWLANQFKISLKKANSSDIVVSKSTHLFTLPLKLSMREKEKITRLFWLPVFAPMHLPAHDSLINSEGNWNWRRYDWDWTVRSCSRKPRKIHGLHDYLNNVKRLVALREQAANKLDEEIRNIQAPMPNPLQFDPWTPSPFVINAAPPSITMLVPPINRLDGSWQGSMNNTRTNNSCATRLQSGMHTAKTGPLFRRYDVYPGEAALSDTVTSDSRSSRSQSQSSNRSRPPSSNTLYSTDEDAAMCWSSNEDDLSDIPNEAADMYMTRFE